MARSSGLDLLRIAGITCVVAGHVWGDVSWVRTSIYAWHVPVFFFLTGYLWTTGRRLQVEVRKRTPTLVVPYVAWLVLIGVPFVVYEWTVESEGPIRLVMGIAYGADLGRPFSAFWFVAALFFTAVLVRASEQLPRHWVWLVAVAAVALTYPFHDHLTRLPLAIGLSVPCTVFLLAGQEYRRWEPRVPYWAGFPLIATGAALAATVGPVDLKGADFGWPVLSAAAAVLICAGLVRMSVRLRLGTTVTTVVGRMAAAGLVVVLFHGALLWVTDSRLQEPALTSFCVALVGSWLVGLGVTRVPVLSGQPRASATRLP